MSHFRGCAHRWAVTPKFKLGWDFCTMYLPRKFHRPMFTRLEVIMLKYKQTNKQTPLRTSNALGYTVTLGKQLSISTNQQTDRRCWIPVVNCTRLDMSHDHLSWSLWRTLTICVTSSFAWDTHTTTSVIHLVTPHLHVAMIFLYKQPRQLYSLLYGNKPHSSHTSSHLVYMNSLLQAYNNRPNTPCNVRGPSTQRTKTTEKSRGSSHIGGTASQGFCTGGKITYTHTMVHLM